jgi:hypothetical protein
VLGEPKNQFSLTRTALNSMGAPFRLPCIISGRLPGEQNGFSIVERSGVAAVSTQNDPESAGIIGGTKGLARYGRVLEGIENGIHLWRNAFYDGHCGHGSGRLMVPRGNAFRKFRKCDKS